MQYCYKVTNGRQAAQECPSHNICSETVCVSYLPTTQTSHDWDALNHVTRVARLTNQEFEHDFIVVRKIFISKIIGGFL
jgi:hypothetical protein